MLLVWFGMAFAQQKLLKFEVSEFSQDLNDGAAQSKEYQKVDGSGNLYAIIKVKSADPTVAMDLDAFKFNFGNMKHEVTIHEDELWVYVQKNARKVTIRRDGYAPIKDYDLKTTIQAGKTYVMKLTFDKVIVMTELTLKKQFVKFTISPALEGAIISLTKQGESTPFDTFTTDATGSVSQNMDFGTYFYEIQANRYMKKSGKIVLDNSDVTLQESVELTPNFGYLEVKNPGNAGEARVLVDGKQIGVVPLAGKYEVDCGDHTIQLIKDLYKPYKSTFTVTQGQTVTITPELEANFAETKLSVAGNADIYIDEQLKGTGKWAGPLKAGTYIVECKKEGHRPSQRRITIEPDVASTIEIDAPTPITGFLSVSSTPDGASIIIDGKDHGVTPRNISDVIIGHHEVKISKPGHRSEVRYVDIEEGKQKSVDVQLNSEDSVTFTSNRGVYVWIDGKAIGHSPCKALMSNGVYKVEAREYIYMEGRYARFKKNISIDVSNPNVYIKMKRLYAKKNCFYIEGLMQSGSMNAFGGSLGFHAGHFNMQGFYMLASDDVKLYTMDVGSYDGNISIYSEEHTLKPLLYTGGRMGWGFRAGRFFRFTPQLGADYLQVKDEYEDETSYSLSGVAGLRCELDFSTHWGLSVTPEISFPLSQGDKLKEACKHNDTLKKWTEGFNLKAGLFFFF